MSDTGDVTFTSVITKGQVFRLSLSILFTNKLLWAYLAAAFAVFVGYESWSLGSVLAGLFLGAWFAVGLLLFVLALALATSAVRAYARGQENLFRPVTWRIGPTGISVSTATGSGSQNWGAYVKWRRFGEVFLIFPTSRFFQALNTAGLSAADRERLAAIIDAHVGKPANGDVVT